MSEPEMRRAYTSDAYFQAMRGKASFQVGNTAVAGYWKTRWPDRTRGQMKPVSIVEVTPTDPETGEICGDVTYEAFIVGESVPVSDLWPHCGKYPIEAREYEMSLQQTAPPHPAERAGQYGGPSERAPFPIHAVSAPAPDRMQSDDIAKLCEALAKAQGEIEGAVKGRANPHFKSTYADLASVWQACRAALSGNGIAVVQMPESTDGTTITLITTLTHSSGQWMRSRLTMKAQRGGPQDMVSLVTYMRRTALAAMVGVAPVDDDDDGEGASGRDTKTDATPKANARHDEALAKATEWANVTRDLLDKAKSVADVMELMNSDDAGRKMKWLYEHARSIYDDVRRSQEKAGNRITKAAA